MSKTPGTIALFPLFILGRGGWDAAGTEPAPAERCRSGTRGCGAGTRRGRCWRRTPGPRRLRPGPGPGPGHAGLRPRAAGGRAPRLGGCQPRGLPRSELRARRAAGGPRGRAARGAGPEALPEGPPRAATAPRAGAGRCRRAWHRSVPPGPALPAGPRPGCSPGGGRGGRAAGLWAPRGAGSSCGRARRVQCPGERGINCRERGIHCTESRVSVGQELQPLC